MHIVFVASECVPYAKTGGLADVIGALPREIVRQGHQVTVYLPFYRQVQKLGKQAKVAIPSITIPGQSFSRFASVMDGGVHDGVQFYFVDIPEFFDREGLYGVKGREYGDNGERYGLFCRVVIESVKQLGVPDLFHVHDWQASMVPVMLRTLYSLDPVLRKVPCLLTIHNAGEAFQGRFPSSVIDKLLLPWDLYTPEWLEFYNQVNFLKGGIVYCDAMTTVSRKYAEEIQTPELGNGLDGVLRARSIELTGILNGIDYNEWNPATDRKIAAHYTAERPEAKADCRRDLLHAFGLQRAKGDRPVLGMVSWLATQKGFDLLAEGMPELMERDVLLVVLGTGEAYYEGLLRSLAEKYPDRVAVKVAYDNTLAHKIEAGADIFLMPSRYEPCGLSQMYSLKYGTVPVVHATGGLEDTIEEWNPEQGTGTGFKFANYDVGAFLDALRRALEAYKDRENWRVLMRNGMLRDFSWTVPAGEYVKQYEECVRRRS
ncbi:MAG: glycogen synthase GlgA [Acidobacteriaceae bacterium]